jgi:hypothetical protein
MLRTHVVLIPGLLGLAALSSASGFRGAALPLRR